MQYIISDTFKISGPSFNDWKFMLFYLAAIPSSIFVPGTKKIFLVDNLFSPGRFEPVLASVCWYYLYPNFLKDRRCCCNSYKDNLKRKGLKPFLIFGTFELFNEKRITMLCSAPSNDFGVLVNKWVFKCGQTNRRDMLFEHDLILKPN